MRFYLQKQASLSVYQNSSQNATPRETASRQDKAEAAHRAATGARRRNRLDIEARAQAHERHGLRQQSRQDELTGCLCRLSGLRVDDLAQHEIFLEVKGQLTRLTGQKGAAVPSSGRASM